MQAIFRLLRWALKAALFFTLFAFALNNQHEATVHFFFGTFWRAPLVLVVLAAFSAGVADGRRASDTAALIADADAALYRAKSWGRNQVVVMDGRLPTLESTARQRVVLQTEHGN